MRIVGEILIVAGAAWCALAAAGINRFGDLYARMHAATKAPALGLLLVLSGTALHLPWPTATKVLLAGLLLFLTAPVGAHLVGRSVHRRVGRASVHIDRIDELADIERVEREQR